MSETIITVENISKKFFYNQYVKKNYTALRDVIMEKFWSVFGFKQPNESGLHEKSDEFFALKNISFEVKRGDRIGIIGRNGAGKSTLLKILSRILEPTEGRVTIRGRAASLLEVGTGFHPELTGRENVFMNGIILGMTREEIQRKFDEIVQFAEVESFIDTPLKHYSSGMQVRLAFAVAAYLEPEILIIDEVLAVGDMRFQKKCLGKMEEVSAREGRTILFVSHQMSMIRSLCNRAVLLNYGKIEKEGPASDVIISYYNQENPHSGYVEFSRDAKLVGDEFAVLISGSVRNEKGEISSEIGVGENCRVVMKFRIQKEQDLLFIPNVHLFSPDGSQAFDSICNSPQKLGVGEYSAECFIPGNLLNDLTYSVGLALASNGGNVRLHFFEKNVLLLNVKDPIEGTPGRHGYGGAIPGIVRPLLEWKIEKG